MKSLIKNLKQQTKNTGKFIWENLFSVMIILFILDLAIAGLLFWQIYLIREADVAVRPEILQINQALLDDFSSQWQARVKAFEKADSKQYPNLFHGGSGIISESEE